MLNIQGTGSPQQHIPILLNNCTIFQPAHSIRFGFLWNASSLSNLSFRCYKTSHQAPILQLQIQQGTTSAILTQGQILSPRNIIVVASNAVGAVDHQVCKSFLLDQLPQLHETLVNRFLKILSTFGLLSWNDGGFIEPLLTDFLLPTHVISERGRYPEPDSHFYASL